MATTKYQCACGPKTEDGQPTQQERRFDPYEILSRDGFGNDIPTNRFIRRSIALTCSRCDGRITEVAE